MGPLSAVCFQTFMIKISQVTTIVRRVQKIYQTPWRTMSSSSLAVAPLLLTPSQLKERLAAMPSNVRLLDCSWVMPNSPENCREQWSKKRIQNASFLDLDQVASQSELGLKHMMPDGRVFADACGMCS